MRVGFTEEAALEPGPDCVEMAVGGDTQVAKLRMALRSGAGLKGAFLTPRRARGE